MSLENYISYRILRTTKIATQKHFFCVDQSNGCRSSFVFISNDSSNETQSKVCALGCVRWIPNLTKVHNPTEMFECDLSGIYHI